jgi:hypothetical protein
MLGASMERELENEVCTLLDSIRESLASREVDLEKVEEQHVKVLDAIKQLEAEARTKPDAATRKALQGKVKQFKDDCKALRAQARSAKEELDRASLLSGGMGVAAGRNQRDQEDRLIDRLEDGTATLEKSRRAMLEMEETAAGVQEQLAQNRATINSTRRKLEETNTLSGRAAGILRRMEQNELLKRTVAYVAVGIVGVVLLVLLYSMLFGIH